MLQEEAAQKRRTLKEDINAHDQQRWIRTKGEEPAEGRGGTAQLLEAGRPGPGTPAFPGD